MRHLFWLGCAIFTSCVNATPLTPPQESSATTNKEEAGAIPALKRYLATPKETRGALEAQPFAVTPLTKDEAPQATKLLLEDLQTQQRSDRKAEFDARELSLGDLHMPFWYKTFGEAPAGGHSVYISMHGGGGAPAEVNDSQWENQKTLYQPKEGIYVCPRAPTNTWDLWHQSHIDPLFARLIEDLILFEGINPDRVYLMGYSAGGDGVYQIAPRMADLFAAASMMAGHPNEASPVGLRNLPFAIHVGELDSAYDRNKVAVAWGAKLDALQKADPKGYTHLTEVHKNRAHWMNLEDASAVEWMAQYTRNNWPTRVVWHQDDVTHLRFYWLSVEAPKAGDDLAVSVAGQTIEIEAATSSTLTLLLSDELLSLDQPVIVIFQGKEIFRGAVQRNIKDIERALKERPDPRTVYSAALTVQFK